MADRPLFPVTEERIAWWECAENVAVHDAACEIRRLQLRERQLLEVNNTSLMKARGFEAEANQAHCETVLLRNECARLRDAHSRLASFIEECHNNAGEGPPDDVIEAMDAVFPPEAPRA